LEEDDKIIKGWQLFGNNWNKIFVWGNFAKDRKPQSLYSHFKKLQKQVKLDPSFSDTEPKENETENSYESATTEEEQSNSEYLQDMIAQHTHTNYIHTIINKPKK